MSSCPKDNLNPVKANKNMLTNSRAIYVQFAQHQFLWLFWMEPSPSIKLVTLWFKLLFDMQSTKCLTQALFSAGFPRQPYSKCKQVGRQGRLLQKQLPPAAGQNNNMKKYGGIIRWPKIRLLKREICMFITFCYWGYVHLRLLLSPTLGCYNQVSKVKQE